MDAHDNNFPPVEGVDWMHIGDDSPPATAASLDGEGSHAAAASLDGEGSHAAAASLDGEGSHAGEGSENENAPEPPRDFLFEDVQASPPPSSPVFTAAAARVFWGYEEDEDGADRTVWLNDGQDVGPSGWMNNDVLLASDLMNAAYNSAMFFKKIRGKYVRRLNCHWNRELDHDVMPHGYNARGDIAPPLVHAQLDIYLDMDHFSWRERTLAHSALDKVWLLHSRSERVDEAMDREFWFLPEAPRRHMGSLINEHMLDDMRLVMCTVDPRKKVIYGKTLDSSPAPRLLHVRDENRFMSAFFSSDNDDGDSDKEFEVQGVRRVPYTLSGLEQHQQLVHRELKVIQRREKEAILYEDYANQAQIRLHEIMKRRERANTLLDVIMRGVSAERGPLELLPTQESFAFSAIERKRREVNELERERELTAQNRPPTPAPENLAPPPP